MKGAKNYSRYAVTAPDRAPAPPTLGDAEVARWLRPQPPIPVPRRSFEAAQPPGLVAHQLLGHLGHRVITRDGS